MNNIVIEKLQKYRSRIQLIQIDVDDLKSLREYSSLLLSKELYDHIPTEVFLVFQTDALICEKFKDQIYDFIEYDYVGAPVLGSSPWNLDEGAVGNGGLSLRRKSKMLEIIDKCKVRDDITGHREDLTYEDMFFSFPCEKVTEINKPPVEDAKNFSVETVYNDKAFGIHKAYAYHDISKLRSWCPQIEKLSQLQK